MSQACEWCQSAKIQLTSKSVFWELPDGTRAIEITETPTVHCEDCAMDYQSEPLIKEIEDQLFLVNSRQIGNQITYKALMELPRLLKRNYFDFSS